MTIEASAPTRIDLSGGTIDIWPLYLFHKDPLTLNVAINLYARARIQKRDDARVRIRIEGQKLDVTAESIEGIEGKGPLALPALLLKHFKPDEGLDLEIGCDAPAGSGLGGSSALNVAISASLCRLSGRSLSRPTLVEVAKNLEVRLIRAPTGAQDHCSAVYGGVSAIWYRPEGVRRERLRVDARALENRLVLCYTGQSRASATTNWEAVKRYLDNDAALWKLIDNINQCSLKMREALLKGDFDRAGELLGEEMENRRGLSKGILTREAERLSAFAAKNGAISGKVCGAGGGGCIVFFAREGEKKRLQAELMKAGTLVLPFEITSRGLQVRNIA